MAKAVHLVVKAAKEAAVVKVEAEAVAAIAVAASEVEAASDPVTRTCNSDVFYVSVAKGFSDIVNIIDVILFGRPKNNL